jgi:hypothetical protein
VTAEAAPVQAAGIRSHLREIAVGLVLGSGAVAVAALMTESQGRVALGVLLAGIGWVYFGFAVADGRTSAIVVQAASASLFLWIAYLGVQLESSTLLGAGFLAHAAWDAVHHEGHGPTRVRTWYPPFCVTADVVIGVPLIAGWL